MSSPLPSPCLLLSGGETTVTLKGDGRGGRNVEFLLSLAIALNGQDNVFALAGDTDGVDGVEEIAGAIITPETRDRALAKGLNWRAELENNNGHGFFEALGDSVITGPTRTNVNDFPRDPCPLGGGPRNRLLKTVFCIGRFPMRRQNPANGRVLLFRRLLGLLASAACRSGQTIGSCPRQKPRLICWSGRDVMLAEEADGEVLLIDGGDEVGVAPQMLDMDDLAG